MKRVLAFLMIAVMVLCFCACDNNVPATNADATTTQTAPSDAQTTPSNTNKPTDDGKVALDVFAGLTVEFTPAINGCGKAWKFDYDYNKVDYDKSNADLKAFLQQIEFYSDCERTDLRNGDTITVNVTWSKSTADSLGVKLLEESKQIPVTGLYDVYRTAAEVSVDLPEFEEVMAKLEAQINHYMLDYEARTTVEYRYFCFYENDSNGDSYVRGIAITAVVHAVHMDSEYESDYYFYGYQYLYQSYYKEHMTAQAEVDEWNNYVSEDGTLKEVLGKEHIEEIMQ